MDASTVGSLKELIDAARAVRDRWAKLDRSREVDLWFRGVNDRAYDLLPGLYRPANKHLDEITITADFESLAPMYVDREPRDSWDWYFTAQHYGVPTRLLDWSENLLIALYFAVTPSVPSPSVVPCIWIIDPAMLNVITIGPGDDSIIAPGGDFSAHWLPERLKERLPFKFEGRQYENRLPIAISPRRATRRIVAQQGMFTVHGTDEVPLANLIDGAPSRRRLVARIDLDASSVPAIRGDLRLLGMNRLSVFPELQQIGEHLRETYASPGDKSGSTAPPASERRVRRQGPGSPRKPVVMPRLARRR